MTAYYSPKSTLVLAATMNATAANSVMYLIIFITSKVIKIELIDGCDGHKMTAKCVYKVQI